MYSMPAVQFGAKPYSRPTPTTAPTGSLCLPEADAGEGIEDVEALACDGSAALVSLLPNAG